MTDRERILLWCRSGPFPLQLIAMASRRIVTSLQDEGLVKCVAQDEGVMVWDARLFASLEDPADQAGLPQEGKRYVLRRDLGGWSAGEVVIANAHKRPGGVTLAWLIRELTGEGQFLDHEAYRALAEIRPRGARAMQEAQC